MWFYMVVFHSRQVFINLLKFTDPATLTNFFRFPIAIDIFFTELGELLVFLVVI